MPDLEKLELANKYGDIDIETKISGELAVNLFSGKLETTGSCENLDLTLKYGKGRLPNIGKGEMELFDSDLYIGELSEADFNSKYSEVEIENVSNDLTIQTFDDKWEVGHIKGLFKFNDKYSEFEFDTFNDAEGTIFDGKIVANSGNKLELGNSKYSKYKIKNIDHFEFDVSFDDHIEIENANAIIAANSKYTKYAVESLKNTFNLNQSFDDVIDIDKVAAGFKSIYLDGKYVKMNFSIEEGGQFPVDVYLQYGEFKHPEFDVRIHKEIHNKVEVKGHMGSENKGSSDGITIKGFDNHIHWK